MCELALRNHDAPVQLKEIAAAQRLSEKYLGRLMAVMVSVGLVRSRRGKNGGFTLARPSSEITVLDILRPLEGPIAPAPCLDRDGSCPESAGCVTREIWRKTQDTLTSTLQGVTLEDLARPSRKRRRPGNGRSDSK